MAETSDTPATPTETCLTNPWKGGATITSDDDLFNYSEISGRNDGDDETTKSTMDGTPMTMSEMYNNVINSETVGGEPWSENISPEDSTCSGESCTFSDLSMEICSRIQSDLCHTYSTMISDEPGVTRTDLDEVAGCSDLGAEASAEDGGPKCGRVEMFDSGKCFGSCGFDYSYLECLEKYGFQPTSSPFKN